MSVYWIVFKTSIWTQDLLGGFPYSSAVDGFKWMSRPWSTPKNLGNSFSDPQEVSTTLLLPVPGKCFPNLQFLACHHHVGVSSSRSAKQQTNLPKNAGKSLPITSWYPDLKLVGISTKSMNSHFGAQKRSNSHIDEFHGSPGEIAKRILKYSRFFCMFFGIEQFFFS